MTKVIVQIPCHNEARTIARTISDVPRRIPGVDAVEILVIDDGSTDDTTEAAWAAGADHVVRHTRNKGLAEAFRSGIDACLSAGADIIVNTDGDNQYAGHCIPKLVQPILDGQADMVIGDREVQRSPHYSWIKKRLHALGTVVVQRLSRTDVPDAVSGFRAFSRDAATLLNVVSPFSYTIETLIQAGTHRIALTSVPVETNAATRPSRLFKSIPHFIVHSLATTMRIYTMYHPLRMFGYIGIVLALGGLIPIVRFLYFVLSGDGAGHIQSLILGGVLVLMGFIALLFALVADLVNFNRQLIETTLQKVRRLEGELEARGTDGPDTRLRPAETPQPESGRPEARRRSGTV